MASEDQNINESDLENKIKLRLSNNNNNFRIENAAAREQLRLIFIVADDICNKMRQVRDENSKFKQIILELLARTKALEEEIQQLESKSDI